MNIFKSVQIQLTAWYVGIIMFITLSFSLYLYLNVVHDTTIALEFQKQKIERRLMQNPFFPTPPQELIQFHEEALEEIRDKFLLSLAVINGAIFIASSFLGYFLAKRTLKPIEDMVIKQKRFVSDAAHEIKTPITAIKSNLEVTLRDRNLNVTGAKQSIEETIKQIDSLSYITEKLLKQSKYQTHENLEKKKISLTKNLEQAIDSLQLFAKTKNITLESKLQKSFIYANYDSILEMNKNIIENAIKYSEENSSIEVNLKNIKGFSEIRIKDKGIGISKKDLDHIFEPFYRADKSREKNNTPGYGLGLTIVKEVVTKNNGNIEIESKLNKGTTVIIKFPKLSKKSV